MSGSASSQRRGHLGAQLAERVVDDGFRAADQQHQVAADGAQGSRELPHELHREEARHLGANLLRLQGGGVRPVAVQGDGDEAPRAAAAGKLRQLVNLPSREWTPGPARQSP